MTEAEAYEQVMAAIIKDRDRAIERVIQRGIQAGVALERERIRALIGLPAAKGLESTAVALALSGSCSIEAAEELLRIYAAPPPLSDVEARARRAAFKIVKNSIGETCDAKLEP